MYTLWCGPVNVHDILALAAASDKGVTCVSVTTPSAVLVLCMHRHQHLIDLLRTTFRGSNVCDMRLLVRLQDLRQALSELEGKLKGEQREHAATRVEVGTFETALERKAATLRGAEAEVQQLKSQMRDTEALLRELTQAKLEEGGNDAADRRAQRMHAVRAQTPRTSCTFVALTRGTSAKIFLYHCMASWHTAAQCIAQCSDPTWRRGHQGAATACDVNLLYLTWVHCRKLVTTHMYTFEQRDIGGCIHWCRRAFPAVDGDAVFAAVSVVPFLLDPAVALQSANPVPGQVRGACACLVAAFVCSVFVRVYVDAGCKRCLGSRGHHRALHRMSRWLATCLFIICVSCRINLGAQRWTPLLVTRKALFDKQQHADMGFVQSTSCTSTMRASDLSEAMQHHYRGLGCHGVHACRWRCSVRMLRSRS